MSGTRTSVTFNGVDLTSLYVVSGWHAPLLGRSFDTADITGMDGQRFLGATLTPKTITLSLTVKGTTLADRETAARTLAATLNVDGPKALTASFMGGKYYLAIPKSDADLTRFVNADTFEVQFYVPDPVAYGETKTVSNIAIASGTNQRIDVGGTYPALPTIKLAVSRSSTTGDSFVNFRVYHYGSANSSQGYDSVYVDFAELTAGTATATGTIYVFSAERRYTYDTTTNEKLLPLASDWPTLVPGRNQLSIPQSGTTYITNLSGTMEVTYTERWL